MRKNKTILKIGAILLFAALATSSTSLGITEPQENYNEEIVLAPDTRIRLSENCELIPLLSLDAYGTYSYADSGDVWGAIVSGSVSPVVKYGDNLYLIPLYDGSYERQRFFASVEEGGRLYNEVQHHDLSLTAKCLVTNKLTISPYIFGGWDLNVEADDEDWGDGLYDYREFGSGADFGYLVSDTETGQLTLSTGGKWYFRKYPNYKSLIALATVTAPEEDEKDFNAAEFQAGCQYSNLRTFSVGLKYSLLMKFFTDKKVIDADGVLEDDEREEYRNSARLEASYAPLPERGFQYSCSSEFAYNTSNQNFYDSRATLTLADDVFTSDYFDYISYEANPRISYIFKSGDKTLVIIGGGYNFLMRDYTDRKAQTMSGEYTSDEQRDYQHIFEVNLEIPFNKYLSWVTRYDYTINDSNMDYEQYYEYNYTMHRILSGISFIY